MGFIFSFIHILVSSIPNFDSPIFQTSDAREQQHENDDEDIPLANLAQKQTVNKSNVPNEVTQNSQSQTMEINNETSVNAVPLTGLDQVPKVKIETDEREEVEEEEDDEDDNENT